MGRRLIIAGGGTGGHIFPALAIAGALKSLAPDTEILFVGARGKMEMEKIPQAGFTIRGLDIAGFNRSSLIKNAGLPIKLLRSFMQVRSIIREFRPDAVIGVGGYSSFPVLRYAQARGIPTFIHESNSFAGKSNILLGRKARAIFVASEGMEKFFPADRILVTGNPVRKAIVQSAVTRTEAAQAFSLDPAGRTVLFVGGSLGAKSINEAVDHHLDWLLQQGLQLIWQTGKPYGDLARLRVAGKKGVWTGEFINRMELAYGAADIVVSRAGAMAIAELCVVKKPVIFVPYPYAAEDHQTVNAQHLVSRQAALMVKDSEADEKLAAMLVELSRDEALRQNLVRQIGTMARTDADRLIAQKILDLI
ncbi:MAG TPA: undecaprenyldiphospho-muramoylpentapeptide beta-N-acetylglucosaminyltransferase [Chitinophagaceae bacterium]|nr:undecaprenyldiphospho-muramoylpentapeptide beta-N-acetylglucosaminyltransferase [Chitinophagaceae bacterium]